MAGVRRLSNENPIAAISSAIRWSTRDSNFSIRMTRRTEEYSCHRATSSPSSQSPCTSSTNEGCRFGLSLVSGDDNRWLVPYGEVDGARDVTLLVGERVEGVGRLDARPWRDRHLGTEDDAREPQLAA